MLVSEIRVKQIRVNQGLGVSCSEHTTTAESYLFEHKFGGERYVEWKYVP